MSTLAVTVLLAAALLGGPVDLFDAPLPPTPREGFVALGTVRVHLGRGEIEVDGYFNLRRGFIEYLATSPGIKAHESLIALDCDPVDLNAACLLIGLEPGTPPESEVDLGPIAGPRVIMRLRYAIPQSDGSTVVRDIRAEDVILNGPMEWEMARCGFVYTGSSFIEDYEEEPTEGVPPSVVYAPRVRGELIALSHRPYAIFDNPLALPFKDGDYYAYGDVLPSINHDSETLVSLVIRLPRRGEIDPAAVRMELPKRPEETEEPNQPKVGHVGVTDAEGGDNR